MLVSQALSRVRAPRPRLVPLQLPPQSNPGRYGHDGATQLINCYAENAGKEAKLQLPIYACDGLDSFATLTGGMECRGIFATETYAIVVSGRLLFVVDAGGAVTTVGGIPDEGAVTFSRNRATVQQIVITTTGGAKYVLTITPPTMTLTAISDPDLQTPNSNAFIDGYTLYFISNGRVYFSSIDDATAIDGSDFFEAEGNPDKLVRGFVHNRTIFLFGTDTTELWDSVGDATDPFQRAAGGFLQFGCLAPSSVVSLGQNVALVNNSGKVVIANSAGATQTISTPAVERAIAALTDNQKVAIEGFVYERPGHRFYVLSAATFTWIYDETIAQWHERKSYGEDRWRAAYYAKLGEKHIVGDFESGLLYQINPDTYDEAGENLVMTMRTMIHGWPNHIRIDRLRFDMIPGVGLDSSDLHTSDPQLMLRTSLNGGKSFGNERTRPIGKIGQHTAQTSFEKLGTSGEDGFVIEASVSAAVIRAFTGISGEITGLRR